MNAVLAIAPEATFSIGARIRQELEGDEVDPHVIAQNIIATMTVDEMRLALATALPEAVRRSIHTHRQRAARPASDRWNTVAELQGSGELALLRARVFASGAWKFLGDCTREDVESVAVEREENAAQNMAVAVQFRAVATAMKRKKAATVRELPGKVLNEIFDA